MVHTFCHRAHICHAVVAVLTEDISSYIFVGPPDRDMVDQNCADEESDSYLQIKQFGMAQTSKTNKLTPIS